jgi:hypothetical protein
MANADLCGLRSLPGGNFRSCAIPRLELGDRAHPRFSLESSLARTSGRLELTMTPIFQ